MKHILLLLMLCCSTARAQDPGFWIGAWNFTPRWNAATRNAWAVQGMLNTINPPPPDHGAEARTLLNCLADNLFPQARLLGLNLAGINVRADEDLNNFHDHVVPDHNFWNNNAVDEVCRSADAQGLHVLVRDGQLSGRYMGERIMLHPESMDTLCQTMTRPPFSR